MQQALEELQQLCPTLAAAAVVGADGAMLASIGADTLEAVVGPATTTLTTIAERAAQELGRGALGSTILQATFGNVVTHELGDGRTLVVVSEPSDQLGLLLDDVRACGQKLEVAHA